MSTSASTHALMLQAWLSPAFPTGAYSYSHALEYAVEADLVDDTSTLEEWVEAVLRFGAGRSDGVLLGAAHRAASLPVRACQELLGVAVLAAALRPTSEFALESAQQGSSFFATVRAAWPHPRLDAIAALLAARGLEPALPVAVGAATAVHGIALELVLPPYLQSFAVNIVSAGARLIPLGQTDCQRVIAALQSILPPLVSEVLATEVDDIGSGAPVVDWCSMRHETQYTRLFRS